MIAFIKTCPINIQLTHCFHAEIGRMLRIIVLVKMNDVAVPTEKREKSVTNYLIIK